ncbi:MAG: AAA family ATPase, partial [Pseudomonadota bacterium]
MYVQHFGLKKRPFHAKATGTDVFVGPQTVTAIAGIKTALQANDSIVTVVGPVGAGKTTLVTRALEAIGKDRIIVKISRMRLTSDDVLEHLLSELGADTVAGGTIRKFTEFRRQLLEHEKSGTSVFVVVEDATRLDVDTLA